MDGTESKIKRIYKSLLPEWSKCQTDKDSKNKLHSDASVERVLLQIHRRPIPIIKCRPRFLTWQQNIPTPRHKLKVTIIAES